MAEPARGERRGSLGRFAADLARFLAPLLLLAGILEGLLAGLPSSYSLKKALVEQQADRIEVLVMGTSHSYLGVDPRPLRRRAFNLANVSQSLRYDRLLVERYLDRLPRLRLVVLPVSYHSLRFDLSAYGEDWRMAFYERVYGFPCPLPRWDPRHYSALALYGGPNAGVKQLLAQARGQRDEVDAYDAQGTVLPRPHAQDLSDASGRARVRTHEREVMQAWAEAPNEALLAGLLDRLAARHVRAVLVTLPVSPTYSRWVDPALYTAMQQAMARLTRARPQVPYLNYFTDARFVPADYRDNDHLAPQGATKFSRILDLDLAGKGLYEPVKHEPKTGSR